MSNSNDVNGVNGEYFRTCTSVRERNVTTPALD